jgi:hypothetical protein
MGIPAQVLRQEEEAERLMGNPEEDEIQETEESEEEITEEAPKEEIREEPAPQEEEPVVDEKDRAYWEQRFKVMEGKFKSEVPRLSEQIRDLMGQNDRLTNLIATLQEPNGKKPEITEGAYLSDEEFEKLEEEGFERSTIDLIGNMAERIAEKRLSGYDTKLDKVASDVEVSSKDRFFSELTAKVPDWELLNVDEGFIKWLSEPDGYSGYTRQQSLDGAYGGMDTAKVANIFNAYKKPAPSNSLEKQVAPGRGTATATPASQKKVWSRGEITKFYSDQVKGKHSDKEAARLEKDIFLAQKEGRITP